MCMWVYMCVCERDREKERDMATDQCVQSVSTFQQPGEWYLCAEPQPWRQQFLPCLVPADERKNPMDSQSFSLPKPQIQALLENVTFGRAVVWARVISLATNQWWGG